MDKFLKIAQDIRRHYELLVKSEKSFILSLDINISQGGIRSWKFFKKNSIKTDS